MSRRNSVPSYRLHRASGQAVTTITDSSGNRKDCYLGPFGSAESKVEYARIIAEWSAAGREIPVSPASDLSIAELILRFWKHVEFHYRHPSGEPTSEREAYRLSLRELKELYAHHPARDFGPLGLRAVRESMITKGLCRRVINQRVGRIRRLFRWAASEELIPVAVYQSLTTLPGLASGRTAAPDHEPIRPVEDAIVDATMKKLGRHAAGAIRFMKLTGCRPQDACNLRWADIDRAGEIWLYRPRTHKTAWRDHSRTIAIGPMCQALLSEFPTESPEEFVFSPARQQEERMAALREKRVTPVQPSQRCRSKRKAKRKPGQRYSSESLCRAVHRACDAAKAVRWHPNQLRHAFATNVRRQHGLEAAGAALGHSKMSATEIYAERDEAMAREIAAKIG